MQHVGYKTRLGSHAVHWTHTLEFLVHSQDSSLHKRSRVVGLYSHEGVWSSLEAQGFMHWLQEHVPAVVKLLQKQLLAP